MKPQNKPLLIIFGVVFLDLLGFGIVIPILPYYASSMGASGLVLGLTMMCYSLMQFVFSPIWGRISDIRGRRPVILICLLGMSLAMLLLGVAHNIYLLFLARLFAGLFGANISAATAYIADNTTPEERTKGMGIIGAAFGLGFLFGPALGGILSKWGYGTVGFVAAALSVINFIYAYRFLNDAPQSIEERSQKRTKLSWNILTQVFASKSMALPVVLFFLVTLAMAHIETVFGLYLLNKFQLDAYHAGLILALSALVMALVQGGLIGRLSKKLGEKSLIIGGVFLMILGLLGIMNMSATLSLFIACMMLYTLGYSITNPSLSSTVSKRSAAQFQGLSMGVYHAAGSLGRILGPLSAGVLFDLVGINMPFMAACVAIGVVLALALMLFD